MQTAAVQLLVLVVVVLAVFMQPSHAAPAHAHGRYSANKLKRFAKCNVTPEMLSHQRVFSSETFNCTCHLGILAVFWRNDDGTYLWLDHRPTNRVPSPGKESMCPANHTEYDVELPHLNTTLPIISTDCAQLPYGRRANCNNVVVHTASCESNPYCPQKPRFKCHYHRDAAPKLLYSERMYVCGLGLGCHTQRCR